MGVEHTRGWLALLVMRTLRWFLVTPFRRPGDASVTPASVRCGPSMTPKVKTASMATHDASPRLAALVESTHRLARQDGSARATNGAECVRPFPLVTLELRVDRGLWSAVLARAEERVELGGLPEVIRYLELLAVETARPAVRGLR